MASVWRQTLSDGDVAVLETPDAPPASTDVLILGAGLIGLATAYYLAETGVTRVCVFDPAGPLAGASGANAGGLWFSQLSPQMGPLAPLARASSRLYDDLAADLDSGFDLQRPGLIELLTGPPDQLTAVKAAGFRAQLVSSEDVRRLEPVLAAWPRGAILYPDDGHLNPLRLGVAFLRRLRSRGVPIIVFRENEPKRALPAAGVTVVTAGAWTPLVTETLGWTPRIRPIRGQLLATDPQPTVLRHTVIGPRFYYWQLAQGHIAGGGTVEDVGFTPGTDPADLAAIREELRSLFPALGALPTPYAWSGFRPFCEDLLPVIGRVPGHDRVFVAAGHFKKGVMLAPATGKILADLITTGRTDLPIAAFDPARFPATAPEPSRDRQGAVI